MIEKYLNNSIQPASLGVDSSLDEHGNASLADVSSPYFRHITFFELKK